MLCFVKHVHFDGMAFRLCFSEYRAGGCTNFFVLALDEKGNKHPFTMEEKNNAWRIVNAPKVADPLLKNEGRLSLIINDHLVAGG